MDEHIKMLGSIRSKEDFLDFRRLYIPALYDNAVNCYREALTA